MAAPQVAPSPTPPPVKPSESVGAASTTPGASPAEAEPGAPQERPAEEAPALTRDIPKACPGSEETCEPPPSFVETMCKGKYPDFALLAFSKAVPWAKAYVKDGPIKPVNLYGGALGPRYIERGEEVVLLKKRGPGGSGGMQISGPGDVDVLRWDGTCATIGEETLVNYMPASMISIRIVWKFLEAPTQEALLKNNWVRNARAVQRKVCHDSSVRNPKPKCDNAMKVLTDAITVAVRGGVLLPEPSHLPEWRRD